jgi:hypothetical protein
MTKPTIKLRVLLAGNIILASALLLSSFKNQWPIKQDNTLTVAQARTYHNNYDNSTSSVQARIEGIAIDRAVVADINAMLEAMPHASGVRLYFGKKNDGTSQNILVATTQDQKDDLALVLRTSGALSICPNICDVESQITRP